MKKTDKVEKSYFDLICDAEKAVADYVKEKPYAVLDGRYYAKVRMLENGNDAEVRMFCDFTGSDRDFIQNLGVLFGNSLVHGWDDLGTVCYERGTKVRRIWCDCFFQIKGGKVVAR